MDFQTYIRTYNNTLAFTSFGVTCDTNLCYRNKGIYTFRVQGQVYHYINELLPLDGVPSYLQLYFYDTEHEIENRMNRSKRLNPHTLEVLLGCLSDNPYSKFFRNLSDIPELNKHRIVLRCDAGLDQRVYNAPSASQVGAIWLESDESGASHNRDIVVYSQPNSCHKVKYYFGCYDPLQYPLLFPFGDVGWHHGIPRIHRDHTQSSSTHPQLLPASQMHGVDEILQRESLVFENKLEGRTIVSCCEYYCYKLQLRQDRLCLTLRAGRLFQQFVVDMYIKVESSRLDYIRAKQREIRADLYQGIVDSVELGETRGSKVGRKILLPTSFIGGPRDTRRRYVDAMAIVQKHGKPDLFITMTCNPNWPEIKSHLATGEEAQNRPDLASRVFRAKLEELKDDLFKKQIFGQVAGYVYVVEFQKRGLPHAHFLLILKRSAKIISPEAYDRYVCAELPQCGNHHLRAAVIRHMLHGPCGEANRSNVCMKKDGTCKNYYPKQFCEVTKHGMDSYAVYRRRNNNDTVRVRGSVLDNRWVIPYNPYLLAKYDCHMNVEICSTIKAVKYLYKYILKGHDRVSFHVSDKNTNEEVDEIQSFQSGRWVGPPEAMWRIYQFTLNAMYPSVINLQLHLPNKQTITFQRHDNLKNVASNSYLSKTMLTEYFRMNSLNDDCSTLLYREFPEKYVWKKQDKKWTQRRRKANCIGRLVTVNPAEGERYY